jgi:hypothetical protein
METPSTFAPKGHMRMARTVRCRLGRHAWTAAHPQETEPQDVRRVCRRCGKTTTRGGGSGFFTGGSGAAVSRGWGGASGGGGF